MHLYPLFIPRPSIRLYVTLREETNVNKNTQTLIDDTRHTLNISKENIQENLNLGSKQANAPSCIPNPLPMKIQILLLLPLDNIFSLSFYAPDMGLLSGTSVNKNENKWRPMAISNPSTRLRLARNMPQWVRNQDYKNNQVIVINNSGINKP
ncbi:hypothetical protein NQ317_000345 [Molorchus minor]|uniref:Uncharacterized protein n=1 Tax=Molorchus minor TaxID=1323400 RepID=A0ABQ9K1P5_9CUCU|nr:hypothetical protein NQ317_000345 [Molorchus minor]